MHGKPNSKYEVVLLKDHPKLGKKGDIKKVRRGYYRLTLLPEGYAKRQNANVLKQVQDEKKAVDAVQNALLGEANAQKAKIEGHGAFTFVKKVREGKGKDAIYGSVSQINVAEEIAKATGIAIRRTAVEVPKIATLGSYTATVELSQGVTAVVKLEVVSDNAPAADGEDEEGEEASE